RARPAARGGNRARRGRAHPHHRLRRRWRTAFGARLPPAVGRQHDRRGRAGGDRRDDRWPQLPCARRGSAGGHLRRNRPHRAGRGPRRSAAPAPGALPLAAGPGPAGGAAGRGRVAVEAGTMTLPFADLQLLRPAWLLALVLLPLLAWVWRRRARRRSAWRAAVDPHLLPHLLERGGGRGGGWAEGIAVLCGLALLVLALAGPSWRAVPQPLQARAGALVVAVDLSSSVLASDLQPNRLVRARARIGELLAAFAGEVGLVAYADDAFVVSPLTPDAANVAVFLDALAPDIMPLDGQRAGRAIERAAALLEQAGHGRGDILLLAPTADEAAVLAAGAAMARGYRVS